MARADLDIERARTPAARQAARDRVQAIADLRGDRAEEAARTTGLAETLALALARGEEVDVAPRRGAARMSSRDGLKRLRQLGHLTDDQFAAGLAYRAGHESRGRELQAASYDRRGGGHDNDRYVEARLRRAKGLAFVSRTDQAVAQILSATPLALTLLRAVAGEGASLSTWGVGRALERNRDLLRQSLDLAVAVSKSIRAERQDIARREQSMNILIDRSEGR